MYWYVPASYNCMVNGKPTIINFYGIKSTVSGSLDVAVNDFYLYPSGRNRQDPPTVRAPIATKNPNTLRTQSTVHKTRQLCSIVTVHQRKEIIFQRISQSCKQNQLNWNTYTS